MKASKAFSRVTMATTNLYTPYREQSKVNPLGGGAKKKLHGSSTALNRETHNRTFQQTCSAHRPRCRNVVVVTVASMGTFKLRRGGLDAA